MADEIWRERPWGSSYVRGLQTSARDNASAYGYSVTITSAFGILSAVRGSPGVAAIFAFAIGAILAFSAVEAVASGGFRHGLEDEPSRIRALGSSISFLSVGLGILTAFAVGRLAGGLLAWAVGSFFTTVIYLLFFALEISVAECLRDRWSG